MVYIIKVYVLYHFLFRYGLTGFAGLMLRNDFMESIETLKKIVGMVSDKLKCLY